MISLTSEPEDTFTIHAPMTSASPVSEMASPMIITPMVRMTVLEANWPKAVLNSLTPRMTISAQPRMAVVAMGSRSLTNRTMITIKMMTDKRAISIILTTPN